MVSNFLLFAMRLEKVIVFSIMLTLTMGRESGPFIIVCN